jgi:hypothetical protein
MLKGNYANLQVFSKFNQFVDRTVAARQQVPNALLLFFAGKENL